MGTLFDTSVLIAFERAGDITVDEDQVGIATITVSELLHGAHRGGKSERVRREAFVEHVIANFAVVPFTLEVARIHAQLWARLAAKGATPGLHDLQIASTAVALGWQLATLDRRAFATIPGLRLRAV